MGGTHQARHPGFWVSAEGRVAVYESGSQIMGAITSEVMVCQRVGAIPVDQ